MLEPASPPPASLPLQPEQPMPRLRHSLYLLGASLLVGLFYCYCLIAAVLCCVLWLVVLGWAILLSYSGALSSMRPFIAAMGKSVLAFGRSLRLRNDKRWEISLSREEAPELWAILEDLAARLQMKSPTELVLLNNTTAWAELSGVAKGRGKTRIGVGLDLLAGLSPAQARAVMGHEIAHAKHVRRGASGFARKGMVRISRCSELFREMLQQGGSFASYHATRMLAFVPRKLEKSVWRLLAACSRYNEFEADRVAGEICGSAEMASALRASYALGWRDDRISWRERVVNLRSGTGYSAWLAVRLQAPDEDSRLDMEARAIARDSSDEFSTHPALAHRLAALEKVVSVAPPWNGGDAPNSLGWLQKPDEAAQKLLRKIEKAMAEDQDKHSRLLKKLVKKRGTGATGLGRVTAVVTSGKNDMPLPVPSLVDFRIASQLSSERNRRKSEERFELESLSPAEKWHKGAERTGVTETNSRARGARLRAQLPADLKVPKLAANFWAQRGAELLQRCDYAEAAHCARLALENRRNLGAAQRILVVCHAAGNRRGVKQSLIMILKRSPQTTGRWAVAWSHFLLRDFINAEPHLLHLTAQDEDNATLWALLGSCQFANAKNFEALASHRRALELALTLEDADNEACHRFELARLLSTLGLMEETKSQLEWLSARRQNQNEPLRGIEDFDLQAEWLSSHLVHGNAPRALEIAAQLEKNYQAPRYLLRLGMELSKSRDEATLATARAYFEGALKHGHYPQALLALSSLELLGGNRVAAKKRLLQSLNAAQATPFDATPVFWQLGQTFELMRRIAGAPRAKVIFYIAQLDTRGTALEIKKLLLGGVYASQEEAQIAATEIFAAILPGVELGSRISVEKGKKEFQPEASREPGVFDWRIERVK